MMRREQVSCPRLGVLKAPVCRKKNGVRLSFLSPAPPVWYFSGVEGGRESTGFRESEQVFLVRLGSVG